MTIGFAFLIHSDISAVMQLLEAVYRPQHYYTFHVDFRKDFERQRLIQMIEERFAFAENIIILPKAEY